MNPKKNSRSDIYGDNYRDPYGRGYKSDDKYDDAYNKEFDSFGKSNPFSAGDVKNSEESAGAFEGKEYGGEYSDNNYAHLPRREDESGWNTDVKPTESKPTQKGWKGLLQANKKKGPIGAIIGLIILGGFGISFLTPGLLLIHITETITDRLDMQGPSLKMRTSKIYAKKLSNQALSGICTQAIDIRCKFNSLNERQLKSLRANGIDIEVAEGKTITGRYKVKSMSLLVEGEKVVIEPKDLSTAIRKYDKLRIAMDDAYSSDAARFFDAKAKSVFDRLGLTRETSVRGLGSDEERKKAQEERVNKKVSASEGEGDRFHPIDEKDENSKWTDGVEELSKEDAQAENLKAKGVSSDLAEAFAEAKKSGGSLTEEVLDEAAKAAKSGSTAEAAAEGVGKKGLGIVGVLLTLPDQACNVYSLYNTVSNGAKIQRAGQLAVFAMDFLAIGHKIKAGDATPEEVNYLASQLTKTVATTTTDESGKEVTTTSLPATDSYGIKYASFGDDGPLTPSAASFVTGGSGFGNMGKSLSIADTFVKFINDKGGKNKVDKACGVIKSPLGQAAIIFGGIGLTIAAIAGTPFSFGGTLGGLALGAAVGVTLSIGLSVAKSALVPMFIDMATGILINDSTFGEKAGDALVSGAGFISSTMAGAGGNAPLSPQDAVAYTNVQNQVLAQKAEDEQLTHSPFDASSKYTFMGRIVDQLIPYSAQTTTISSFANTSYSVLSRSLASILNPSAFAKEATVDTYTQCDDIDYKQLNLATDPFCNPIRGIPPQYLDIDPDTIVDQLIANGDIDETSGAAKSPEYKNFIANCIDRQDPLGYTGDNFDASKDGHDCFIAGGGDQETRKAYWYLYQIDLRVIDGMENGFPDVTCLPTTGSNTSTSTPAAGMADAAKIDSIIESEEGGKPGPMHGKGAKIIELSNQYGVNSNFITTIFREETHFGTDGSQGALHNNFGWNKENGDGDCPAISVGGNSYNCYSTADKGIEGALKNITTVSAYKQVPKEAPPGTKAGTVAAVRNVYCPEGDGNCNLENFLKASNDIGLTLQKDDPVFTNASDTTVVNGTTTNAAPSVAKISESAVKSLISSYGLPEPKADTSSDLVQYGEQVKGYNDLLKQLQENPKAGWAAQAMLNGEKKWKSAGGNMKEYLNTTWVWFENGQSAWPDPYEMNCLNDTSVEATYFCGTTNYQVAGYQPGDVRDKFKDVYDKLYQESELSSVMKSVVQNSTNASKSQWNYSDAANSRHADRFNNLSGVTFNDLWPNKPFGDVDAQMLSLILGKDPNMAAALNSFAVSDDDVLAHIGTGEGCGPGWGNYICKPARQQMANMIMALWLFDGAGPSGAATCKTSGANEPRGNGKGIAAIFNGTIPNVTQEFGPTEFSQGAGASMYTYATEYGMNPPGHTGVDYGAELDTKLYSPVAGTVKIAGGTPYFRSTDRLYNGGISQPGTGELSIMLDNGDELILGHMHKIDVKVGDKITAGQYVGLSGTENGAHVHVEYRIPDSSTSSGQRLVDPRKYL